MKKDRIYRREILKKIGITGIGAGLGGAILDNAFIPKASAVSVQIPIGKNNFVYNQNSAPTSPDSGMLWYDSVNKLLKIYNSTSSLWDIVPSSMPFGAYDYYISQKSDGSVYYVYDNQGNSLLSDSTPDMGALLNSLFARSSFKGGRCFISGRPYGGYLFDTPAVYETDAYASTGRHGTYPFTLEGDLWGLSELCLPSPSDPVSTGYGGVLFSQGTGWSGDNYLLSVCPNAWTGGPASDHFEIRRIMMRGNESNVDGLLIREPNQCTVEHMAFESMRSYMLTLDGSTGGYGGMNYVHDIIFIYTPPVSWGWTMKASIADTIISDIRVFASQGNATTPMFLIGGDYQGAPTLLSNVFVNCTSATSIIGFINESASVNNVVVKAGGPLLYVVDISGISSGYSYGPNNFDVSNIEMNVGSQYGMIQTGGLLNVGSAKNFHLSIKNALLTTTGGMTANLVNIGTNTNPFVVELNGIHIENIGGTVLNTAITNQPLVAGQVVNLSDLTAYGFDVDTGVWTQITDGTLNGTTSGTVKWKWKIDRDVITFSAYLNGYENTTGTPQTITFPLAFGYSPKIVSDDSGGSTVNTTTLTLPASMGVTKTGWIIVEGY